jgi:hypothetical protein
MRRRLNNLQRHDQVNFPNRVPEAANATFGEPFPQKFGLTPIGAIANIAPALSCLGVAPREVHLTHFPQGNP